MSARGELTSNSHWSLFITKLATESKSGHFSGRSCTSDSTPASVNDMALLKHGPDDRTAAIIFKPLASILLEAMQPNALYGYTPPIFLFASAAKSLLSFVAAEDLVADAYLSRKSPSIPTSYYFTMAAELFCFALSCRARRHGNDSWFR